jgi:hypothetical protein
MAAGNVCTFKRVGSYCASTDILPTTFRSNSPPLNRVRLKLLVQFRGGFDNRPTGRHARLLLDCF